MIPAGILSQAKKALIELTYDGGFPVADSSNVAQWNTLVTFFNLQSDSPFGSVEIDGLTAKFTRSSVECTGGYMFNGDNVAHKLTDIKNIGLLLDNYTFIYGTAGLNFNYNKLSSENIDHLLEVCVDSNINNGELYAQYQSPLVDPSAAALTNKSILESRGWLVEL